MDKIVKPLLAAALITLGAGTLVGTAHAQAGAPGSGAPAGPGYTAENTTVKNGGDETYRDADAAREAAIAKVRENRGEKPKTIRTVPAKPEEVTVGAEIRDKKGEHVGVIDSVSMSAAVLHADGGAVEVPLDAFGKDDKGLIIGMTKADFDKLVADALKAK